MSTSESNKAVANLMAWIRREADWAAPFDATLDAHTASTLDAAGLSRDDMADILGEAGSGLLFGCVFEDLAAQHFETAPLNLVDDYLKRRGWRDSVPCRRYMAALRDAIMSVYEVTNVLPGKWVEVRDLVRSGEPVRVFEHLASQQIVRWDRIGARVVDYLGEKVFTGALLPYTVEQSEPLRQLIDAEIAASLTARNLERSNRDQPEVDAAIADTLLMLAPAFTACWLARHLGVDDAANRNLVNFDGDPIMFTETRFAVRKEAASQIVARLDALPHLHRVDNSPPAWDWLGKVDANRATGDSGFMLMSQSIDTGEQVFGSLNLAGDALNFSTNSLARKEQGVEILKTALGDLIGTALTSLTNVEDALKRARETASTKTHKSDPISPDVAAAMRQYLDQYYRKWLDLPVPALDGRSPKQAARTKAGKDEVVALLKHMENMEARGCSASGKPAYDFSWLWQELGLAARRR